MVQVTPNNCENCGIELNDDYQTSCYDEFCYLPKDYEHSLDETWIHTDEVTLN